jgi:uncharacterized protein YbaR (Trm112 family)
MLSEELLAILACPACKAAVVLTHEHWLVCQNPVCGRKYPIKDGIPIMLIEEGDKYAKVTVDELESIDLQS